MMADQNVNWGDHRESLDLHRRKQYGAPHVIWVILSTVFAVFFVVSAGIRSWPALLFLSITLIQAVRHICSVRTRDAMMAGFEMGHEAGYEKALEWFKSQKA